MSIEKIDRGIFRILIPFEQIKTTVYVYVCNKGCVIIDCATYPSDVDDYILPALDSIKIPWDTVKCLILTHDHPDHAGGIARLSEKFPHSSVFTSFPIRLPNREELIDGKVILGDLKAIFLPGHTDHSFGFYDSSTKTLLSGDCLQLAGVGKYRHGIADFDRYIESVNKLKGIDVDRIVSAHEYDPLGSVAEGKASVLRYLDQCEQIAKAKKR